ncbi:MAG: restriction endonuclease [Pseudanabaenaceae cyanobacterium SKYGB_i_bin29]|nr:restriction endonuclease [Pseudanabaenaceae cyanobacterium SKYG29]MDW8422344.1 restriction endonuclease [Pseudanabaenaceae cyanobacterium SKYGB_i_bin29]
MQTSLSMPIVGYQDLMLPLLQLAQRAGEEISNSRAIDLLAQQFNLTKAELQEMLPSGRQTVFANRVGWAATYLKKAGLLEKTRRGYFRITQRGAELLATKPRKIDNKTLQQYPEFLEFKKSRRENEDGEESSSDDPTPLESLENSYRLLRQELINEILAKLRTVSPSFFEQIVVDLVVKLGYGGSRADAGKAIGKPGDDGIDGIIKQDKLGLDVIYLQAKRYGEDHPVTKADVAQFAGALQAKKATKGIFITTSRFTASAKDFIRQVSNQIMLIDGEDLAELMIDHDVGVTTTVTYTLKRIDSDYFVEE